MRVSGLGLGRHIKILANCSKKKGFACTGVVVELWYVDGGLVEEEFFLIARYFHVSFSANIITVQH